MTTKTIASEQDQQEHDDHQHDRHYQDYVYTANGAIARVDPHGKVHPIANFHAWIEREYIVDDGVSEMRSYDLTVCLNETTQVVRVSSAEFGNSTWPAQKLGASAIVRPGAKEHLRVAIQEASGAIEQVRIYRRFGWDKIDGTWVYLDAHGAIGSGGRVAGIDVQPPDGFEHMHLSLTADTDELTHAVRSSVDILRVAPDRVMIPLLGAFGRSIIGRSSFGLHLYGRTGTGKLQLAALIQQHFGRGFDAEHLPGSWLSTANANERRLFDGKDMIVVVDDFCPVGSAAEVQAKHSDADRLFRATGNGAGRERLNSDLSRVPATPPRGTMLSTGEDLPRGESCRARGIMLELERADMNWDELTQVQRTGADGQFARACAGYIQWIAGQYDEIIEQLDQSVTIRRNAVVSAPGVHRRTPENVAHLAFGFETYLRFAHDVGAIDTDEYTALRERAEVVWVTLGTAQRAEQAGANIALRFLGIVDQMLASGAAHLTDRQGNPPVGDHSPAGWGWRRGDGTGTQTGWIAQGDHLGWIDGATILLNPDAALAAATAFARAGGDSFTISRTMLLKRLKEDGILLESDTTRQTLTIRRTIGGRSTNVIVIAVSRLSDRDDLSNDGDQAAVDQDRSVLGRVVKRVMGRA